MVVPATQTWQSCENLLAFGLSVACYFSDLKCENILYVIKVKRSHVIHFSLDCCVQ